MYRFFYGLSRLMAVTGGAVLTGLILLVCVSITGRALIPFGFEAIPGDYEIVEAGMAFAIFCFLPICQITSGHATVDIFTDWMPDRAQRVLRMLIEILFAVALVVIAVQLKSGLDSKIRSGQTTFLLQFPVWWAYAASLLGASIAAVVAVYMALVRTFEAATGRILIADDQGAEH